MSPVLRDPRLRLVTGAVVDGHVMSRTREMSGHRTAHDAKTDKAEFHCWMSLCLREILLSTRAVIRVRTARQVVSSAVTDRRFRELQRSQCAVACEPGGFGIIGRGHVFYFNADVARLTADFDNVRVVLQRG